MGNIGTTKKKNLNSVYIHSTLKRVSVHCGIKLSFTVRKLRGIGGEGIKLDYTCLIMSSRPIKSLWMS